MPTIVEAADTPIYVLMDGSRRIGPQVVGVTPEVFVYGFSGKAPYDKFCASCELSLQPYPLVKGYLKNQVAAGCATFIAIDADGPRQTVLDAATAEAVLEAQEHRSLQVATVCRLTYDEELNAYRKSTEELK